MKPIEVGDTFTHAGDTFTRLSDSAEPFWPSEPYRIQHHPNPATGARGMTFEQGPLWFKARGLLVAQ